MHPKANPYKWVSDSWPHIACCLECDSTETSVSERRAGEAPIELRAISDNGWRICEAREGLGER